MTRLPNWPAPSARRARGLVGPVDYEAWHAWVLEAMGVAPVVAATKTRKQRPRVTK